MNNRQSDLVSFCRNPAAVSRIDLRCDTSLEEKYKEGQTYIDRSLMIKEFFDSDHRVTVLTAPPLSGKTLLLSTIDCFFNIDQKGKEIFKNLAISKLKDKNGLDMTTHQSSYPVIKLCFKYIICGIINENFEFMMKELYEDNVEVMSVLSESEKEQYNRVLSDKCDDIEKTNSLRQLMHYLYRYYNKKVMILVDDYDATYNEGVSFGRMDDLNLLSNDFNFLIEIFKISFTGNDAFERALLVGTFPLLIPDANHVQMCFSKEYARYFGINKDTVKLIFPRYENTQLQTLENWCGGYGENGDIFNFFAVRSQYYNDREYDGFISFQSLGMYGYVNLADNIFRYFFNISDNKPYFLADIKDKMRYILNGGKLYIRYSEFSKPVYFDRLHNNESSFWVLLFHLGLLVPEATDLPDHVLLFIPNLANKKYIGDMYEYGLKNIAVSGYAPPSKIINNVLDADDLIEFWAIHLMQKVNRAVLDASGFELIKLPMEIDEDLLCQFISILEKKNSPIANLTCGLLLDGTIESIATEVTDSDLIRYMEKRMHDAIHFYGKAAQDKTLKKTIDYILWHTREMTELSSVKERLYLYDITPPFKTYDQFLGSKKGISVKIPNEFRLFAKACHHQDESNDKRVKCYRTG